MMLTLEFIPHRKSFSVMLSLNNTLWFHYSVTLPPNHSADHPLVRAHTSLLIPEYRGKLSFPVLDMGN